MRQCAKLKSRNRHCMNIYDTISTQKTIQNQNKNFTFRWFNISYLIFIIVWFVEIHFICCGYFGRCSCRRLSLIVSQLIWGLSISKTFDSVPAIGTEDRRLWVSVEISFRIISMMIHSDWNSLYFIVFIIHLKIPKTENSVRWRRICVSSHDSSLLFGHTIYWATLDQFVVFFSVIRYQRFNCLYWQHQKFI